MTKEFIVYKVEYLEMMSTPLRSELLCEAFPDTQSALEFSRDTKPTGCMCVRETRRERFIIRDWFMQLMRLVSPKICSQEG